MSNKNVKTIVIFGSSSPTPGSDKYIQAYDLGKALAQSGYRIANGGYGGTMAAAARAVRESGSNTIGVTCEAFGRNGPNPWIEKEISTNNLYERLNTLINLADAFIILPGSTGTLLELATCWELMNKHFLPQTPIICLTNYWKPVIDTIVESGENNGRCIRFADSLNQLLQILRDHFAATESAP